MAADQAIRDEAHGQRRPPEGRLVRARARVRVRVRAEVNPNPHPTPSGLHEAEGDDARDARLLDLLQQLLGLGLGAGGARARLREALPIGALERPPRVRRVSPVSRGRLVRCGGRRVRSPLVCLARAGVGWLDTTRRRRRPPRRRRPGVITREPRRRRRDRVRVEW